jgi:hypothetical protein
VDVFERSNDSLAFQIYDLSHYNGCGVIHDQLYILTDDYGMKSTSTVNRTSPTMTNWPVGSHIQGLTNMAIDSSGRTYTACSNCGLVWAMWYAVLSVIDLIILNWQQLAIIGTQLGEQANTNIDLLARTI